MKRVTQSSGITFNPLSSLGGALFAANVATKEVSIRDNEVTSQSMMLESVRASGHAQADSDGGGVLGGLIDVRPK